MKAIVYTEYGSPDVLELKEVVKPTPKNDEVLVKVYAVSANAADLHLLRADPFLVRLSSGFLKPKHTILGSDIAGRVEALGSNAKQFRPGDEVFGDISGCGWGGFAEYALADVDSLGRMPDGLTFEGAAGLVVGGGTAWDGLVDHARLQADEMVLITGAAGGVGSVAVQVAAALGARPLGAASERNHDYLRGLGASEVFDYHVDDWVKQVLAVVPGGVDVLFDAVGGLTGDQAVGAVREGGRAIFLNGAPARLGRGVVGESLDAEVNRQKLDEIGRLAEAGSLRPQIEAALPFEQVRDALERVAGRHTRGKIVLQIG